MENNNIATKSRSWIRVDFRKDYEWLLIVSCIPLFSTKALFNLPLFVMAVLGIRQLVAQHEIFRQNRIIRTLTVLFLCLWIPLILSLPDAVNPARSIGVVARYLLLILAGIFIVWSCRSAYVRQRINVSVVVLVIFLCVDSLIQYFLGRNLLGNPMMGGRVTSIFYPKLHMGLLLAVLSPVVFEYTRQKFNRFKPVVILPVVLIAVILMAGNRVSWIMLLMAASLYLLYHYRYSTKQPGWRTLLSGIVLISITLLIVYKTPFVKERINETDGVFSTDFATIDKATAYRLSIWKVGLKVFQANWINGIGPRGFRYVYAQYADKGNYFLKPSLVNKGATHPHLMILEVAVETGIPGLLGYLLFFIVLCRYFLRLNRRRREFMFPWMIAILVAVFPLNAHMAWYASYWAALSWWVLAIALGMTGGRQEESRCES